MNKAYGLLWSQSCNAYVVVPEITRGRKKRTGSATLLMASILLTHSVWADNVIWATAYPTYQFPAGIDYNALIDVGFAFTIDGNTIIPNHYAAGTTLNILGPIPVISAGQNGISSQLLVRDGLVDSTGPNAEPGRITTITATDSENNVTAITSANIGQFSYTINPPRPQQDQELNVVVPGLEGSYSVISVYDSGTFSSSGTALIGNLPLSIYDPSSFRIYNKFGIARVGSTGGIANINIGAGFSSPTIEAPANTMSLLAKNSVLAQAEATAAVTSSVNWASTNYVQFMPAVTLANDTQGYQAISSQYNNSITLPNYIKAGPLVILNPLQPSITFTINSGKDIATVNDFLLGQGAYPRNNSQVQLWLTGGVQLPPEYGGAVINSATIAQSVYNSIIQGLLTTEQNNQFALEYHIWNDMLSHTNNATLATGNLNIIYATGGNASGMVTSSGNLAVEGASAVMRGDDGATITNNGHINIWRNSATSPLGIGMQVTDATAINNNILNAGLFLEKNNTNQNKNNQGSIAMQGSGASLLAQNGIINVALTNGSSASAVGMLARDTTIATNHGTIALVGNSHNPDGRASGVGADISGAATFTNALNGAIMLGITPITGTPGYSSVIMVGSAEQSAGIRTSSSGAVTNQGTITLGEKTRNAVGILINGGTGSVTNNGTINVLGVLINDVAAPNYGLSAIDTTIVTNNGNINVNGDNNVAINLLADNNTATVNSSNTSVITIGQVGDTGGSDNNPYTYRNFAVYAEGLNNQQATVHMDSQINLLSAGAIGVHARGSSTINLTANASLTFNNSNQIGYYAYGRKTAINIAHAALDDNNEAESTLFLLDHGATFDGNSGTLAGPYQLTVSGNGSIGVFANGLDNGPDGVAGTSDDLLTTLNTGTSTIRVNGTNTVGVKVTGGAMGTINDGGIIFSHNNTTGVMIDGRNYTLDGKIGSVNNALSTNVTSSAKTTTEPTQSGITGYDVSYSGELTLTGSSMDLAGNNNTGLYLHNGGVAINSTPMSISGTNNLGVYIQDQGTLTNTGIITVSGASGSNNVGVKAQGAGAQVSQLGNVTATGGLAAVQMIGNRATLSISGTGNHITASGGADGIRMDTGASTLTVSNSQIDMSDTGAGINNNANTSNINLSNVTINAADGAAIRTAVTFAAEGTGNTLNVASSGAGFAFEQAGGGNTTGNLTIGAGYTINVTGTNGNGIQARTVGNVTSGANIAMSLNSGAAISAMQASAVTNSGNIQVSSNTHSVILADNASAFTNSGTINASSTINPAALIRINGTAATRTILNSGNIIDNSPTSVVIDASGSARNTITNRGGLSAASKTATAIRSGSGNDSVTLTGATQQTTGLIALGSGNDTFTWDGGTLNGAVDFTGADGNDRANIGNVDLTTVSHLLTEGGINSILTFTNTRAISGSAQIGSLSADRLPMTNIGSGWSTLIVTGSSADVRIVDNVQLSSGNPLIQVNNGAILRSGDNVGNSALATINNYNVATAGSSGRLIFDGTSATQTYSGVISGTAGVERASNGMTTFLGNNTYTGNTLIGTNSVLQLGNGGTTGGLSTTTNITDNGILTVNRTDNILLGGAISGTGAFHQSGSGTTRLGGANSYQASTQVNSGTLLVNGNQSQATGLTSVASGATLGGKGTIGGDVTFAANTTLTPGDNGAGTLNIAGNLFLSATTSSRFELGERFMVGGTFNDLVTVGKNLTLDGTLHVTTSSGGQFLPGVYRLFNYNGTLTDRGLDIISLPADNDNLYIIQTTLPQQVNLVLGVPIDQSITLQYWDGDNNGTNHGNGISGNGIVDGGHGTWQSTTTGNSNNWTTSTGVGNAPWSQSSYAIFQGQAGTVTVSDLTLPVLTSGMQFAVDGYLVTGDPLTMVRSANLIPTLNYLSEGETAADAYFVIRVGAGAVGADYTTTMAAVLNEDPLSTDSLRLLKADPGRLILTGNNVYRGGTEIYGGTLNASTDHNLGLAGTSIFITHDSTLQIGADFTTDRSVFLGKSGGGRFDLYGHTFTPDGVISGIGSLTVLDSTSVTDSMLVLNHVNTYQGATTVTGTDGASQVVVNANVTGVFGQANSQITVNHQGTIHFNHSTQAERHPFILDSGILHFNDTASAANSVTTATNGAIINLTDHTTGGAGRFTLASGTSMNLSGQANAGTAHINSSGLVSFADQASGENAVIVNNAGGVVNTAGVAGSTMIGSLSGAGNVKLGLSTLYEGTLNLNDAISGIISGNGGSLGKVGGGTLTLSGNNSYTGITSVQQGVLLVNGDQQAATGEVNVNAFATLGGNGTLGGDVTVADNAHLAAGADLSSIGVLTMGGLFLHSNAQIDFQFGQSFVAGGSLNDLININGDLNLNGKLNIDITPGGTFNAGVYRVFNYTGKLTDNTMEIGIAPERANHFYVQTSVANQVNLINKFNVVLRFWDGHGGEEGENRNNGFIDGGDGVWQSSLGNDNWTTDITNPDGRLNSPYSDGAFAVFGGEPGHVTVDNSVGQVLISGMQFATDGYVISQGVLTTNTPGTVIRVGNGTLEGTEYIATVHSYITGTGGIDKTDVGTLILTGNNSYTGGTQISGGTLQVSADKNLGASGTGVTFDGGTLRYAAAVDTRRPVSLLDKGGRVDTHGHNVALQGEISGSGSLTKIGAGTLTLTQDNSYTGGTTISQGNLQLGDGGQQGGVIGNIVDHGVLQINRANTLNLTGNISGSGQLWQQGSGITLLSGNNTYSGTTLVEQGTLRANGRGTFSADSVYVVSTQARLETGGTDQVVERLVNQGTVSLQGAAVGSTLTVNGDYIGLNGTLHIAAQQHSPGIADRLVIDQGTATGHTLLDIDVSQLGKPTTGDGITVVEAINGATTTAQTTRDAFTLGAEVVEAGAFEYRLFAGDAQGQGENWFLRTDYRPEIPNFNSITSTIRQADLAVLGTLHLRIGDEPVDHPDQEKRFWARYITQSNHQSVKDVMNTKTDSRINGLQFGGDLYTDPQWRTGVYTSVLDTRTHIQGRTAAGDGAVGDNSTLALYLGGYATWTREDGVYVDSVLQYGHHQVDLKNRRTRDRHSLNGNTYIASVETGYPFQLSDSRWVIEPQAQLIYQHSDFDPITLKGEAKTRVSINADDVAILRLGLRLITEYDTEHGKVQPYIRVNWWQQLSNGANSSTFNNTTNINGEKTTITANQRYSLTEVAIGTTWSFTGDIQVYAEAGKSHPNGASVAKVEHHLSSSIGVKMRF